MAEPIAALIVRVLADTGALVTGMQTVTASVQGVEDGVKKTDASLKQIDGTLRSVGSALGLAFSVDTIIQWHNAIRATAADIDSLSDNLADSAENVQRLQAAAIIGSTSVDALGGAIQTLQLNLESGRAEKGLRAINLTVAELQSLSPVEAYLAVATALGDVGDSSQRLAIAQDVLGRAAKQLAGTYRSDLVPALEDSYRASNANVEAMDANAQATDLAWQSTKNFLVDFYAIASGARANAEGLKIYNEQLDESTKKSLEYAARTADIALPGSKGRAARPTPDEEMFSTGVDAANAAYQAGLDLIKAQQKDAALLGEAWLSVWEHIRTINNEMKIGLTIEGQRLNNAIMLNYELGKQAAGESGQILDRLRGGSGGGNAMQDEVNAIMARADADVARLNPNITSGADAIAKIYERANLEIAELSMGLQQVTSETTAAKTAAEGVLAVYQSTVGVMQRTAGAWGYIDQEGNPTTEGRSAVLANMPAGMRQPFGGGLAAAAGAGLGLSGNHVTVNINAPTGASGDITRLVEDAVMNALKRTRNLPG